MVTPASITASIPVEGAFTCVASVHPPASSYHSAAYVPVPSLNWILYPFPTTRPLMAYAPAVSVYALPPQFPVPS